MDRSPVDADAVRQMLASHALALGSQKALAEKIGVTQAFVCDIINGRREPSGKPVAFLGLRRVVSYEFAIGKKP
jgi:DNA-binding transcriptional regulator YdaS (Cro superfamily)